MKNLLALNIKVSNNNNNINSKWQYNNNKQLREGKIENLLICNLKNSKKNNNNWYQRVNFTLKIKENLLKMLP